jgi:hypothetical protein
MKTPRNWKTLKRHPLSAEYPDLGGRAREGFDKNLKKHGLVGQRKIMLHDGMVIDGWQLQLGCIKANIKPKYEILKLPEGMTLEEYVGTVNDHRRHETQEQAIKRAEDRRQRVAAARASGMSQRAIADQEGVSQQQIRRDLEDSGETPVSPEPVNGTVQGLDGKLYPAIKETGPNIPERLQQYFASVPMFQQAVQLISRLANVLEEIEKTPAYLKACEGKKRKEYSTHVRGVGRAIEAMTPARPCTECGGIYEPSMENDPCKTCMDKGYQTAEEIEEVKE